MKSGFRQYGVYYKHKHNTITAIHHSLRNAYSIRNWYVFVRIRSESRSRLWLPIPCAQSERLKSGHES